MQNSGCHGKKKKKKVKILIRGTLQHLYFFLMFYRELTLLDCYISQSQYIPFLALTNIGYVGNFTPLNVNIEAEVLSACSLYKLHCFIKYCLHTCILFIRESYLISVYIFSVLNFILFCKLNLQSNLYNEKKIITLYMFVL